MYKLYVDKHYIIEDENGKRFLIDTGMPYSFTFHKIIDFHNKTIKPSPFFCYKEKKIKEIIEMDVDGFIGMDLLGNGFTINKDTFEFDVYEYDNSIDMIRDSPIMINVEICGKNVDTVVDTGAMINYIDKNIIGPRTSLGTKYDYNPAIGEINANYYLGTINGKPEEVSEKTFNILYNFINPKKLYEASISFDFKNRKIYFK